MLWKIVALLFVVAYVLAAAVMLWAERQITAYPPDSLLESLGILLGFAWFTTVGAVIIARRPRNPMGWILAAVGLPVAVSGPLGERICQGDPPE